jgi:hypothetical protein
MLTLGNGRWENYYKKTMKIQHIKKTQSTISCNSYS